MLFVYKHTFHLGAGFTLVSGTDNTSSYLNTENRLLQHLFGNNKYSNQIRPVKNVNTTVSIKVQFVVLQLFDLVYKYISADPFHSVRQNNLYPSISMF